MPAVSKNFSSTPKCLVGQEAEKWKNVANRPNTVRKERQCWLTWKTSWEEIWLMTDKVERMEKKTFFFPSGWIFLIKDCLWFLLCQTPFLSQLRWFASCYFLLLVFHDLQVKGEKNWLPPFTNFPLYSQKCFFGSLKSGPPKTEKASGFWKKGIRKFGDVSLPRGIVKKSL